MDNKSSRNLNQDSSGSSIDFEPEEKDDKEIVMQDIYETKENVVLSSHSFVSPDPGFWSWTSWIQLLYGIWVNMTFFGIGLTSGFAAVAVPQLESSDSRIKSTEDENSWIASVTSFVSPIGCIASGFIMDKLGRRWALILCEAPQTFGWLYTGLARSASDIIIGRVINGIGCGMAMPPPKVYGAEISLPNMRGTIGALSNFSMSLGMIIQAILGSYCDWDLLCFVNASFVAIFFVANFFLPESPYYQLMKHGEDKAERALRRFRSKKHRLDYEMQKLIYYKRQNDIRRITLKEEIKLIVKPMSYRPFIFVIMYHAFAQLSGSSTVRLWTVDMLEDSKSSVDAHVGNVILTIARLIAGVALTILIFKFGRRPLSLVGTSGVSASQFILAIYITCAKTKSIIPQICYTCFIVFCTISYYNLPMLLMSELYPLKVRGLLSSITMSLANIFIFIVNIFFTRVHEAIGFANTIFIFATVSLIGTVFLYYNLPETMNLTLHEVEDYYRDKNGVFSAGPFQAICKKKQNNSGVTK